MYVHAPVCVYFAVYKHAANVQSCEVRMLAVGAGFAGLN